MLDLTESNPTHAGIPYPDGLLTPLTDPGALRYDPLPFGLEAARRAVAADCARRHVEISPDDIVLTASTSEAYSWLFKLLCNPGDTVAVPRPSYPLFDHLTALDGVKSFPYALEYHGRWSTDVASLGDAPGSTRAVLVVSPNNPTGSYITAAELDGILQVCRMRGWALIVDEVFADYPLDAHEPLTDIAARADVLTFSLAGLSKTVGLPQLKLGWIVIGGAEPERIRARHALELIADTYLSVATPVQVAASRLFEAGTSVREAVHQRIRQNLAALRTAAAAVPATEVLRVEGGWSAVLRVPAVRPEDQLVLELLERQHVLVHPGYFFDFPNEAYLILSLLPEPGIFAEGVARLLSEVRR